MLGTGATGADDLLLQRFSGPEHADRGVVVGDAGLRRVVLDGEAIDLDTAQRLGVRWLEVVGEPGDTLANGAAYLIVGLCGVEFGREGREPPLHDLVAPVVIQGATSRTVYLPPGEWFDVWDPAVRRVGPSEVTVEAPNGRPPVFSRAARTDLARLASAGD